MHNYEFLFYFIPRTTVVPDLVRITVVKGQKMLFISIFVFHMKDLLFQNLTYSEQRLFFSGTLG